MDNFSVFLPIAKVDVEKRTVSGYASTPAEDSDGEVITLGAIKAALPSYMKWRNIREMHKLNAVGTAQEASLDEKGLYLTAKIVDEAAWTKCREGVYKGFSIGGQKRARSGKKITAIDLTEISVVDRPANPECSFDVVKAAKPVENALAVLVPVRSAESKALAKMAKIVETLAKGGPPAAHDGFSLPAKPAKKVEGAPQPDGVPSVNDSRPNENVTRKDASGGACAKHGKTDCAECMDKSKEPSAPYGDVEYADPGHQADGKKRYPIDNEDHIRAAWSYINKPKNAAKYSSNHAAGVKSRIVAAWKKHIHPDGPPSADAKGKSVKKALKAAMVGQDALLPAFLTLGKTAKAATPAAAPTADFLTLGSAVPLAKRMSTVGSLAYTFDSLRQAQRSLILEGRAEKDSADRQLADRLGVLAKDLAGVMAEKATHEGGEATSLSDVDDSYINQLVNGDKTMSDSLNLAAGGDALGLAVLNLLKKAAEPSMEKLMKDAGDEVEKARKAMKECRKAIEDCHKMHKAAYLSKMAKAKKAKGADEKDDEEFDHEGAMEKLNKAFGEAQKARTFGKAAVGSLAKAAGRAGQVGQEVGDGNKFYSVPPGVKDLSPSAIAGASPGGEGSGGQPPMYPGNGAVYANKAAGLGDLAKFANKDGMIPANQVELMMKAAAAEAEVEALRRIPLSAAQGRRPMQFDTAGVFGKAGGANNDLNKSLFDGVNPAAIGSGDERAHTEASARVIGNMLTNGAFAKSIIDPSFRGAAGS